MFDRNRSKFMNNGGQDSLGNRRQGYGLQQLNQQPQQPQPNMNAYNNANPNARFMQDSSPAIQPMQGYQRPNKPLPYQPQPYMQNPAIDQQPVVNPQMGSVNPQYGYGGRRRMTRDGYINDDIRRRLQMMMMRRRNRGNLFGMDRLR